MNNQNPSYNYFFSISLYHSVSFFFFFWFLCETMYVVTPSNPSTSFVHPKLQNVKDGLRLEHFSDEVVTNHIYTKHREDDDIKIDIDSYILLVESIIITADRITDSVSRV